MEIIHKATEEKYHNVIRYFYHLLEKPEKEPFIINLSEINIVLAAKCLMSDSRNEDLEKIVIDIAYERATDFKNKDMSSSGFLALAEFEQYDKILSLFNQIEKPTKRMKAVLSKIFSSVDEQLFLKFLEMLKDYKGLGAVFSSILLYNGQISISSYSIGILRSFFRELIKRKHTSALRLLIEKFDLWEDFKTIYGSNVEHLINELSNGNLKEISFAKNLSERLCLLNVSSANDFINKIMSVNNKNVKKIKQALDLSIKYSIYDNKLLNAAIALLLQSQTKSRIKELRRIVNKGLVAYIENVPDLLETFNKHTEIKAYIEEIENQKRDRSNQIPSDSTANGTQFRIGVMKRVFGAHNFDAEENLILNEDEYWHQFFNYDSEDSPKPTIQPFINYFTQLYNKDLRQTCQILRKYVHKGFIKWRNEYGYYIIPANFRTQSLLFLHYKQVVDPSTPLNDNENISFRIIGFKVETNRINVSMLSDEQIEQQMR